jgi:hypothetical protein
MTPRPPASRPCHSCPYPLAAPAGVWAADEYAKLPAYDRPTSEQPMKVFLCHQQNGRVCAGWCATHDMDHALAVRILWMTDPELARALVEYSTPVEVFGSGREAAKHGLAAIADPPPAACRAIDRLIAKERRRLRTQDPSSVTRSTP